MKPLDETISELQAENRELRKRLEHLSASEQKFNESEARFRQLVETASDAIYMIDDTGIIIETNHMATQMLGRDKDEIIGSPIDSVDPNFPLADFLSFWESVPYEKQQIFETTHITKGGKPIPVEVSGKKFTINSNTYYFGVARDIASRKKAEYDLKRKELLLRSSVESPLDMIILSLDRQYRYLYFNEAHRNVMKVAYGKKPELGECIFDFMTSEEDIEAIKERYDKGLSGESNVSSHVYGDKEKRHYEIRINPIRDEDNEIIGITSFAHDVTEQKRIMEELLHSEERYKSLVNTVNSGVAIYQVINDGRSGSDYIIQDFNPFALEHEKRERKDVIGKTLKDIRPNIDDYGLIDVFRKVWESGDPAYFPARIYVDEHYSNYYENRVFRLPSGEIVAVYDDVTLRETARLELAENEAKFKSIIENSTNMFYSHSVNGTITFVSPQVQEILGVEPEEAMRDWTEFATNNPINQKGIEYTNEAIKTGIRQPTYLLELQRKDGQKILVEVREAPILENGEVIAIVGSLADVTERKEAEEKLVAAMEKAEESDRLKTAFLANMSHEIRTPMNGIIGFSNLLKKPGLDSSRQEEFINIIEKSGERMLNIINDIIDISKIESGTMDISMKEVNINTYLKYLYSFFKPEAEAKQLELVLKQALSELESIVFTDGEKVSAVLSNLIKNAIKYTKKGFIEFGCSKAEFKGAPFLKFYCKDTGIGIPKDRQEAVLERFVQAEIEDEQARQGAGLGLAISKAYVEMLGGRLWFESEEGKGSVFYFSIPYTMQDDQVTENDSVSNATIDPKQYNLKVLVAEDDEASNSYMSIILKDYAKELLNVRTGKQAIEACRDNPDVDLVLMDIRMPGINGYDASREIRKFNKEVVIIAQTAYGLSGDREKALEAGCNDYIAKPIKEEALKQMIQQYFPG